MSDQEDLERETREQPFTPPLDILDTGDVVIKRAGGRGSNEHFADVGIRKLVKNKEAFCAHVTAIDGVECFKKGLNEKYSYYMVKGSAFSWEEVASNVLRSIRDYTGV